MKDIRIDDVVVVVKVTLSSVVQTMNFELFWLIFPLIKTKIKPFLVVVHEVHKG
jgi:hypothetical protein